MTKREIYDWLKDSKDDTERYVPLVQMICVFEDETENTEVIFAVPIDWLVHYMTAIDDEKIWSWDSVKNWLENEYTSDDSQQILEKAVETNQLAFWRINEGVSNEILYMG